ncbi:hypothetical protein ABH927_001001 [Planotetraspora sp. GP83]
MSYSKGPYRFDLLPVVKHARRARDLETAQHADVLAAFAVGLRNHVSRRNRLTSRRVGAYGAGVRRFIRPGALCRHCWPANAVWLRYRLRSVVAAVAARLRLSK